MESLLDMYWFTFVIYLSYRAELLYCLATGWIYESVIIRSEEKIELEANWLECMFYPSRNQSTAEFYYWRPLHNCILLTQCLHLETITDEGKKKDKRLASFTEQMILHTRKKKGLKWAFLLIKKY